MSKDKKIKAKKSPADNMLNIVITVIVVAVLALAVFAVANKYKPEVYTVSDAAVEQGMEVEAFISEFGLEGAKADDNMEDYIGAMTCANYAKLLGLSYEDFAAQYQLPDTVTPDMTVDDVNKIIEELMALSQEVASEGEAPAEGEPEQAPEATQAAE